MSEEHGLGLGSRVESGNTLKKMFFQWELTILSLWCIWILCVMEALVFEPRDINYSYYGPGYSSIFRNTWTQDISFGIGCGILSAVLRSVM